MIDTAPFQHLFDGRGLVTRPDQIWKEVEASILKRREACSRSFFGSIPEAVARQLVGQGCITHVPAGILMTRKGFCERELFVVVDGELEVVDEGHCLARIQCGEIFGEDAFLQPGGRLTVSVRAISDGRVLVLRGKAMDKLMRREPELAPSLREWLEALFAERLAVSPCVGSTAA